MTYTAFREIREAEKKFGRIRLHTEFPGRTKKIRAGDARDLVERVTKERSEIKEETRRRATILESSTTGNQLAQALQEAGIA